MTCRFRFVWSAGVAADAVAAPALVEPGPVTLSVKDGTLYHDEMARWFGTNTRLTMLLYGEMGR